MTLLLQCSTMSAGLSIAAVANVTTPVTAKTKKTVL